MHIFYTKSVEHLKEHMGNVASYQNIIFPDGEISISIAESVYAKKVLVLTATPSEKDTLIELFLLLDVLKRMKARLYLFFTYFGYARQEFVAENQSHARQFIFEVLTTFKPEFCGILHMHRAKYKDVFDYRNIIPINFFLTHAYQADYIAAPDDGASDLAIQVASLAQKPVLVLKKTRKNDQILVDRIVLKGMTGKKILIVDDMITTGKTMMAATQTFYEAGALSVDVAATHGIFAKNSIDLINKSGIKNIFVTNSLPQKSLNEKIKVVDISGFIKSIINQEP